MTEPRFIPLPDYVQIPEDEMRAWSEAFRDELRKRRTVRDFSDQPVSREVIEACLLAERTAPNGTNRQP
jgi:iodotyrosine deiodinase